jgi:hypothetical protein
LHFCPFLLSLSFDQSTDRIYRKFHDVHHARARGSPRVLLEGIVQIWHGLFHEKRSFCAKNGEKKYGLIPRLFVGGQSEANGER